MGYTFQGRIEKLEIARGYDGLLGGTPRPVIAIGIYVAFGMDARLVSRSLHRFRPRKPFPSEAVASEPNLPASVIQSETDFSFVALAIALEEDGGIDVQRMFGALERHDELTVFSPKRADVDPLSLAAARHTWLSPTSVELCVDGTLAASSCGSDKWVGAVCWAMPPRSAAPVSLYRLPFRAADGRNDWTALVSIGH
jgi:hypothetical protein